MNMDYIRSRHAGNNVHYWALRELQDDILAHCLPVPPHRNGIFACLSDGTWYSYNVRRTSARYSLGHNRDTQYDPNPDTHLIPDDTDERDHHERSPSDSTPEST